ncbi:unnamed protein product [Leuciscus chuanchicus]
MIPFTCDTHSRVCVSFTGVFAEQPELMLTHYFHRSEVIYRRGLALKIDGGKPKPPAQGTREWKRDGEEDAGRNQQSPFCSPGTMRGRRSVYLGTVFRIIFPEECSVAAMN